MKRLIFSLMFAGAVCLAASAQEPQQQNDWQQRREEFMQKMESAKIAFYTEAVGLTPDEAKDFWPIYEAVEKDQMELLKAERRAFRALNDAISAGKSDSEINSLIADYAAASEANVNLHFKAAASYQAVLPPVKVAKFFTAQERFRRQQFNNLRGGQGGRGGHGGHGGPRPDGQRGHGPGNNAPEAEAPAQD